MNIQVNNLIVFSGGLPIEGDRNYLELSVGMSRAQMERAIVSMLGKLTETEASHLLRSEFPELFVEAVG